MSLSLSLSLWRYDMEKIEWDQKKKKIEIHQNVNTDWWDYVYFLFFSLKLSYLPDVLKSTYKKKVFKSINNIKNWFLPPQLNKFKESDTFLKGWESEDTKLSWDSTSVQFLSRKCYSTQKYHSTLFWKKCIVLHWEPAEITKFLELRVFKDY